MDSVDRKAEALRNAAEPYVLALVVRCESPTSAKPGARGVVTRDGAITGWIGGGCAQPIVIEEAHRAIREGKPRLVRITPQAGKAEVNGLITYEMVCHSGGTMDIFIEPVLPQPRLVILGRSPVARTLTRLGAALQYEVSIHAQGAAEADFPGAVSVVQGTDLSTVKHPERAFVVVSTQGEDDEGGMEAALRLGAPYVAFVASPKKWRAVAEYLKGKGIAEADLERVKVPAGIEIKAHDPEEIALSIMAQIVSERRGGILPGFGGEAEEGAEDPAPADGPRRAIDPVCSMTVDIAGARHVSEFRGRPVYFCCAGCRTKFDAHPERYANAEGVR